MAVLHTLNLEYLKDWEIYGKSYRRRGASLTMRVRSCMSDTTNLLGYDKGCTRYTEPLESGQSMFYYHRLGHLNSCCMKFSQPESCC